MISIPSGFSEFAVSVFALSATKMDFEDYYDVYEDLLRVLYFNFEIDTQIALDEVVKNG